MSKRSFALFLTVGAVVGAAAVAVLPAPEPAAAAGGRVALVDQRHGVLVFDLATANWNGRPLWSWRPSGSGWSNLSDVRFRSYGGRDTVLVTASGGRAATVDYATRRVTWSAMPGGNPHSMELLPSGAVVVASSTAGRLTLYGKGRTTGRSVGFPDAHAVLWDARINRLWALGGSQLCSFRVGGSATAPALSGKTCVRTASGGHDLSPVYGSSTGLWFSTSAHVYVYDLGHGRISRAPGSIDNAGIKSIGNQSGGLVVTTQAKGANSDGTWGTGNVWLYRQDGRYVGNRYRSAAAVYKARPVVWERR